MFARCGPATAASAGQAGMTSRLPVIPPLAFRCRKYSSSDPAPEQALEHAKPTQQTPGRLAMDEAQLSQQLDLRSPTDVLRRLLIGPHAKIRSRDINHRVNAIQRRSGATQLARQQSDKEAGSSGMYYRRLRPPTRDPKSDPNNDQRNALMTTMDLLRFQLQACNTPEDFLHLIAVTSKSTNPHALEYLGSGGMQSIMYNRVKDMGIGEHWNDYEVERTIGFINTLHARFSEVGVTLITPWFTLALQRASTAMNWDAIRHWSILLTQHVRASGLERIPLDQINDVLQDLLASIKELRKDESGDGYAWLRQAQALKAILTNLPSAQPSDPKDCSIQSHIRWNFASHVSAYITLLSYLGPAVSVDDLLDAHSKAAPGIQEHVKPTVIHALLRLGDGPAAWNMLATMPQVTPHIGIKLWPRMLEAIKAIPPGLLDKPENAKLKAATEQAFAEILARKLVELEKLMRIRWVATDEPDGGHHVFLNGPLLEHNSVPLSGEEVATEDVARTLERMLEVNDSWVDA